MCTEASTKANLNRDGCTDASEHIRPRDFTANPNEDPVSKNMKQANRVATYTHKLAAGFITVDLRSWLMKLKKYLD